LRDLWLTLLCAVLVVSQLTACAGIGARRAEDLEVLRTDHPLIEEARLDVGVIVFDPGLPAEGDPPERVRPSIRRAESIFFSCLMRASLLESAYWGDVRVVPSESEVSELTVRGTIVASDGAVLALDIEATDATQRSWLKRRYETDVVEGAYLSPTADPYQPMFNTIANDLAASLSEPDLQQLVKLREISALRYGAEFVPDKFNGYLEEENGVLQPVRLPAEDDPIFLQIQQARAYESMFVGTLDTHYENFCNEMGDSYTEWRGYAQQEANLHRSLKRKRNLRVALIPIVIGAVAAGVFFSPVVAVDLIGATVGAMVVTELTSQIKELNADAAMHESMLEELDTSFSSEVGPLVVQTEETTVRLTGNVEQQYQQWRHLLQQLYAQTESLQEMNIVLEVEPAAGDVDVNSPEPAAGDVDVNSSEPAAGDVDVNSSEPSP
jgi:hypothetical protein